MKKFAKSVLITGSSRGIGLELARQLAPLTDILVAACRSPDSAVELRKLADEHSNVKIVQLDILQNETFSDFADHVSTLVGPQGLAVLVNNAGIAVTSNLDQVTVDDMNRVYATNTVAPLMLTKALLPLLKTASSSPADSQSYVVSTAAVVNVSSVMGSITECIGRFHPGGVYAYRSSKAALNMVTRCLSVDLKPFNISAISLHPGWVKTDMGGEQAPLTLHESVDSIVSTLVSLTPEKSGQFLSYDGQIIPW